jgi:heptosyltransferase-3
MFFGPLLQKASHDTAAFESSNGVGATGDYGAKQKDQQISRSLISKTRDAVVRRLVQYTLPRHTPPAPRPPRKLLAVKVHGMGDSIMVRSILEHLCRFRRNLQLGVLVGPATREVMTLGSEFVTHTYDPQSRGLAAIAHELRQIRKQRYDTVLNFEQISLTGTAFLRATAIPTRLGFLPLSDSPKALFLTHPVQFRQQDTMWKSFIRLTQVICPDLPEDLSIVPLKCGEQAHRDVCQWWNSEIGEKSIRAIGLHLGCGKGMKYRQWPVKRFISLANAISSAVQGVVVVLTGTTDEQPLIREFIDSYRGPAVDASGEGSVERTALILKRCDLFVSVDTGAMHLAAAMGTPTVGLFGPNTPKHWAPVGPRATSVYNTNLPCSPCINNYMDSRPLSCTYLEKSRCMLDIDVKTVLSAAKGVIVGDWLRG